ncbi:hypothetical protein WA158_007812 [Blastocystis sp. Blastoise]
MQQFLQNIGKEHQFWNTQPVIQDGETNIEEGPIDPIFTPESERAIPYKLPNGFEWVEIDLYDEKDAKDVYVMLEENYVEDADSVFRFAYSVDCLKWALCVPGYKKEYHLGVRLTRTGQLMGFITGTPTTVSIRGEPINMVDINFLCVEKRIRSKRLAPVLIKEIARRVHRNDEWQAVYTVGNTIPTPFATTTYYHRILNAKKMVYVGFSCVPPKISMAGYIKLCRVPQKPKLQGLRRPTEDDIPVITEKLNKYLEQFPVHPIFTEEEAKHFLLPREGVLDSYVIEDATSGVITSFFSFFNIQSSIQHNDKYKEFIASYSYYYFSDNIPVTDLFADALVLAKNGGTDVFNSLNIMKNEEAFLPLRFHKGDGHLQYYFYNWRLNTIKSEEVGVVLP